ncbi:MAG: T9SS type A sorting domain-containing protein [Saprospiraceae bacterium]|nr:T9SS type A sorting domain-containing protein [Saprospiraceae bacterium]
MIKNLFFTISVSLMSLLAQGQKLAPQVVANAGAVQKAGNFSIEWTLGEMATESFSSGNSKLTQGFHQGNLLISSVGDLELEGIKVYPNPVSEQLVVENNSGKEVRFELIDMNGRLISTKQMAHGIHQAETSNMIPGTYLIQITSGKQKSVHQIQKIK